MVKKLGLIIIAIMIMSVIPLTQVKPVDAVASVHYLVDSPAYPTMSGYNKLYNNLDNSYGVLPNGRMVLAFASHLNGAQSLGSSDTIVIKVYNTDGSVYGSVNYVKSASTDYFMNVGVYVVSDTVVYIYGVYQHLSTTEHFIIAVIKFNPSSLATSVITSSEIDMGGSGCRLGYVFLTTMLLYNSKYYFIANIDIYDSSNGHKAWSELIEYTPDTTVGLTSLYTVGYSATVKIGIPYWFQNSTGSSIAYLMNSEGSLYSDYDYYVILLSVKTQTQFASIWTPEYAPGFSNGFGTTAYTLRQSKFVKGDVIVNGTDQYIYFSWLGSQVDASPNTHWFYANDRMKFSGTIVTANFQAHMAVDVDIEGGAADDNIQTFIYGYEQDKSTVYFYYPANHSNYPGGYAQVARVTLTATNWFDSSTYGWTALTQYHSTDNVPTTLTPYMYYPMDFKFNSQYALSIGLISAVDNILIFTGLSISFASYSAIFSYLPADAPNLKAGTQYTFTVTATVNNVVTSGLLIRMKDNNIEQTPMFKTTNVNGIVTYLVTMPSAGWHDFTWEIYDPQSTNPNTLQYTLTSGLTFITDSGGGGGGGGNPPSSSSWINGIFSVDTINLVIALGATILPTVLLSFPFGVGGAIAGLAIGLILDVVYVKLPFYAIFLILLCLAILIVMVLNGTIGNGNKGSG